MSAVTAMPGVRATVAPSRRIVACVGRVLAACVARLGQERRAAVAGVVAAHDPVSIGIEQATARAAGEGARPGQRHGSDSSERALHPVTMRGAGVAPVSGV